MEVLLVLAGSVLVLALMIAVGRFVRRSGALPLVGEAYLLATGTPRDHHPRAND